MQMITIEHEYVYIFQSLDHLGHISLTKESSFEGEKPGGDCGPEGET